MDNRIPSIIKDYIQSNISNNEVEFLSFNDWLSKNENQSDEWTIVARNLKKGKYEDYYTISCIIQADDNSINHFLSDSHWFIDSEFGIPQKYQSLHEGEVYDDGLKGELNGVTYFPFVFSRHFNGYIPDYFQLIDHFLLYYNCFWIEEKKEYQSINDKGEIKTVIKYVKTEIEESFLIDTHTLKDYLAVRNAYLARFHDHRRRSINDISTFIKSKAVTYQLSGIDNFFDLDLRVDIQYDDVKSTSRLLGKDIIKSYALPENHGWSANSNKENFLEFVIGRDKNGKEVMSNCNPKILSSYFTDTGNAHFLTPVYFKREVMQKYFAEPKKYAVSESLVEYLNIWSIQTDTTIENLVQVYLGDIGRSLPYNEQLHWRQFNVVPKGKISEHRFKRDFLVQFATPAMEEAPISHFKQAFEEIQEKFKNYSGQQLFKDLAKDDQHLYSTLHIPLTEEWKELDEQLLALAKVSTDSFNYELLTILTGKKIGDTDNNGNSIKGLLALFYNFLFQIIPNDEYRDSLIIPFNMVQALRSSSVAHRKSKDLEKTLVKYGLNKLSNEQKFKKLIIELTKSLKAITNELK